MKKIISTVVAVAALLNTAMLGVTAEDITVNQNTDLSLNPAKATVTATVRSQYTVTIPKNMELTRQTDGSYQCNYDVDVDGELIDTEYVTVVPENEITFSSDGKEDVTLTVTQPIQKFRSAEYTGDLTTDPTAVKIDHTDTVAEATGNISVKQGFELSTGDWEGSLTFSIALNSD